jgi:hypothetical protein
VALVAPRSIDNEQDAMIFASRTAALRWVRGQLDANGRPVYGPGYTYRRSDGTLDGDDMMGACWPCFGDTLREGFGLYEVYLLADGADGPEWVGFDYVAAVVTQGPRGGIKVDQALTAQDRFEHIDSMACDHHPDRAATHTNRDQADHLHYLAVFHYCGPCAAFHLAGPGLRAYAIGGAS